MKVKSATAAILIGLSSSSVYADNFASLGLGAGASTSPYKDVRTKATVVPLIDLKYGDFYLDGLEAGYNLIDDENHKLSVLTYYSSGFDPSDSKNRAIKNLDKRRGTMMGGLSYTFKSQLGNIGTKVAADYLGKSKGLVWDTAWLYNFHAGDFTLTPTLGVVWNSKKQNNYYYGLSGSESKRTGISEYAAKASWEPYAGFNANYKISDSWAVSTGIRYTMLSNEAKKSPIVAKKNILGYFAGVSYTF